MEPKREYGDDRIMWRSRPLFIRDGVIRPLGGWAYSETLADAGELMEPDESSHQIEPVTVTSEQWNNMPEFSGW